MTAWTAFASVAGVVTVLLLFLSHATQQQFEESAALDDDDSPRESSTVDADGGAVDAKSARELAAGEDGERAQGEGVQPQSSDAMAERTDSDSPEARTHGETIGERTDSDGIDESGARDAVEESDSESDGSVGALDGGVELHGGRERVAARELQEAPSFSQPALLLNVALSQGVFGVVLIVAAVAAGVPAAALGVGAQHLTAVLAVVGVALGVGLYVVDEIGATVAEAAGLGRSEELRELLAPDSAFGWLLLLGGVLPIVAGFEELLFRGILVGAFATGFDVSPWLLAVGSSVVFGLGHGAQGRLGVLVTTALGVVLAAAFVLTGSLLVVVVAHYLVNALEFVVHEGLGIDWTDDVDVDWLE